MTSMHAREETSQGRTSMRQLAWTRTAAAFAVAAGLVTLISPAVQAQQKTLRFIPEADLRSLDPIWTTAYITRNHGYMVYDTLFAVNDKFEPKPQMVDKWTLSDD